MLKVVLMCVMAFWMCLAGAADKEVAMSATELAVQKRFVERFDNTPVVAVRRTPYGLFEVQLGMDLVYTDELVSFVIDGTLIDAKTRRDVTRERLAGVIFIDPPWWLSGVPAFQRAAPECMPDFPSGEPHWQQVG